MTDSIIQPYSITGLPSDRGIADWVNRPLDGNLVSDRLVIRDRDLETYVWDGTEWTIPNKTTDINGNVTAGAGSFTTLAASGIASFANGSAAAPSISFTSDPNTGFIRSAADSIGIVTGGTEHWLVNASGSLNPTTDNSKDIGSGAVNPRDIQATRKLISGRAGGATGVIEVKGTTSGTVTVSTDATGTTLTSDKPLGLSSHLVGALPSAATAGAMIYVSDAAGSPCMAVSNGSVWKRCDDTSVTVV